VKTHKRKRVIEIGNKRKENPKKAILFYSIIFQRFAELLFNAA
jgi:hypothetical protein